MTLKTQSHWMRGSLWVALISFLLHGEVSAQTLNLTGGIHEFASLNNTTVILTGHTELRVTNGSNPIPGCLIHLNSPDAWFLLPNIRPSVVGSSYLGQVRVNGAAAVADQNVRVVQYAMGTVVIPHPASFQPLQIFSGPHFTGTARQLNQFTLYTGTALGALDQSIRSFRLKRGYMATVGRNEDGTGLSQCYVAQDGDLEVSVLPATLDGQARFVRVFPWRWTSKKGIAGNLWQNLNVRWFYNWNIDQNSSRDVEYVPIRQTRWWPGLNQNWQTRGANTLLGYNEPDNPVEDAYMTVGEAIWSWPDLLGTGLRVGSPAVTDGGLNSWLYPFMDQADAAGLRVDFVAVHYYRCYNPSDPDGATTQFYNFLKGIHDRVQRPLWVTEWNNGANWTGCGDPTFAQQQATVAKMIAMLDNTPFVERYALYNWVEDVRRVQWDDGSLTAAGVTYRDQVSPPSHIQEVPDTGSRAIAQFGFEGEALDRSGFGNNGFQVGTAAYSTGHLGQAIELDGARNFVQLPADVGKGTDFTFAAWVWWDGGPNNGQWQRIFDFGNDTTRYLFLTPSASSQQLRFAITTSGYTGEQKLEAGSFPVGQWTHVAVTLNGNTGVLYTNGVAAQTASITLNPSSFNPVNNYLGKSQFSSDPLFHGKLDDVLIADSALSAHQIAALLHNRPPEFASNVILRPPALSGTPYVHTLAEEATDPDAGDPLAYSKALGPEWLTVAPNGTISGTPSGLDLGTNQFTVRATDGAGMSAFAVLTIPVSFLQGNGTWAADASGNWSQTARWTEGLVASGPGSTADFSTLNLTANRIVNLDSTRSIGTLKFGDTSGSEGWTVSASGGSVLTLDSGSAASPSVIVNQNSTLFLVPLAGVNGFTKSGAGSLMLRASNSISGVLHLDRGIDGNNNDGATRIAHPNAVSRITSLDIRNTSVSTAGGATLQLDGSAGDLVLEHPLSVSCRNNDFPTVQNLTGTNTLSGDVSLNVGGNRFNFRSDAGLLVFSGQHQYVGSATAARIYAFSGAGDHLLTGPILNSLNGAPISLTKSDSGTLTLAGHNTYGSTTTVSGGTLRVNGRLAAGSVTVASGATLGGRGVIGGPTTLQAGATLSPGASIGTLTVNNSLSLAPGSTTIMELNRAAGTNDAVRGLSSVTYGGTLMVTNLAGDLTAGDTFQLFSAAIHSGSFQMVQLPPLNPGLVWDTQELPSGVLHVRQSVAMERTNIMSSVSGNQLTLAWPAEHTGWRMEMNASSLGDPDAWFTLPDSTLTNQVILQIDSSVPNVFYRLVFP